MGKLKSLLSLMPMLLLIGSAAVQAQQPAGRVDAKGGADHELIARYTGSWLIAWRKANFAEVKPLALLTDSIAQQNKLDRGLRVEGGLSELFYVAPPGRSALEVQRNYEDALRKAGATLVYACKGGDWGCHSGGGPAKDLLLDGVVPRGQQAEAGRWGPSFAFGATSQNLRLAIFKLSRGGADSWITVYSVDASPDVKEFANSAATYLQILQTKGAELGKVSVFDSAQISQALDAEGRIALYGIFFDTGKSELKPESAPQLAEMAKLLKAQPALRVYVVGHTDNQGAQEANLALSLKRAEAVAAALSAKPHGIEAKRLAARGVADLSPLASNKAEAGRAKNRRVELVEQ
ncbi:DUF4892 domain-containing protein [Roseateles sp. DAIF2]|uniref:OmpA family protein n=1 Tax=Roseateles sp. DAIF2 TaxID=2714952 RepID=UPI0018A2CCD2|nr:OmpA family protein [Roseateles sp. DAIF2]QPF75406.1 DUF4892 domain-containing protein [Roseateles sp. DAIF2]